jgi:hypothetical protein
MLTTHKPLLVVCLPDLAEELESLLVEIGQNELAAQVQHLRIVDRCRCEEPNCATFYTAEPPSGRWGPSLEGIQLPSADSWMNLDVVDGRISMVEILDRPNTRNRILEVCP